MTDWNKLKVVDLKNELKKRGLPQSGVKSALVARLTAAENDEGSETDATVQDDANKVNADSATSPDTISPTQGSFELPPEHLPAPAPETDPSTVEPRSDTIDQSSIPENVSTPAEAVKEQVENQPQPLDTTEVSQTPSQPIEHPDGGRSAELSVEPRDAVEDRQKRKRRSQSPPPTSADVARKRPRSDESIGEEGATSKEDAEAVEKDNAVSAAEVNDEAKEVKSIDEAGPTIVDDSKKEIEVENVAANTDIQEMDTKMDIDTEETKPGVEVATTSPETSRLRDSRFKDLFTSPQKQDDTEMTTFVQEPTEDESTYISITPAIHPATSALYIRNFVRPLQEARLHDYLTSLATAPGSEPDHNVILHFHIDRLRTHSLVQFKSLSAAARVRSAMHDRVWPEEPNRKALWVDFVPDERVKEWITQEQEAGMGRNTRKWEVVYEEIENDGDRKVTAALQETMGDSQAMSARKPSIPISTPVPIAPSGRGVEGAPSGPRSLGVQRPVSNVRSLNELFKSTTTRPTLYWQPVSKELASKRLDAMEDATRKDADQRGGAEINRYTFEDGDRFVDRGPEIFSGIRPPPGHRGPRGGGYSGRGGGGYGGRRDDRGYDRGYDSYRAPPRDSRDRRY